MGKGVYQRTERHREISRQNLEYAARVRRGKTYEELYGPERAARVKRELAASKTGEQNPAKRPEVRARIGQTAKGRPSWLRGLSKETDPRVKKLSLLRKGKRVGAAAYISEESKARRREKTRATWVAHPELKVRVFSAENNERRRVSHLSALHEGKYANKKDTNIERAIEENLKRDGMVLGKDYLKQVPLPAGSPRFVVDFFIPSRGLVIEGYGCFWHKCVACGYAGPRPIDEKRQQVLEDAGLTLRIIWGHEI